MSSSSLLILACVLFEINAATNIIDPTATNYSESIYIASEYFNDGQYFRNGSLTCNASYCHIVCDVELGCKSLSVYATSSLTTLVIQCLETHSCAQANIEANNVDVAELYCKTNNEPKVACDNLSLNVSDVSTASIYCGWDDCRYVNFYANNIANSLNVTCAGEYACRETDIHVTSETKAAIGTLALNCIGYHGCASMQFTTSAVIDTLALNCGDYGCADMQFTSSSLIGTVILNCIVNHGCASMQFTTSAVIDILALNCTGDYGCYDMQFTSSSLIDTVILNCIGYMGCRMQFNAAAVIDTLALNCTGVYGCYVMQFTSSSLIDTVILNCIGYMGCLSMQFNAAAVINTATLNCAGVGGCEDMQFSSSIIDTLVLKCTEEDSCYSLDLSGDISSNVDIHCGARRACYLVDFDLIPTRSDINVDIVCANPSITTHSYDGACHGSYFDIYGYNNYGVKGSNMTVFCASYDCNAMRLTAFDFNQFDLYCNGTYSCGSSEHRYRPFIYGEASNQFNVHCDNEGACGYAEISCPYHQEQACQIDCAAYPDSCASMAIKVPANYIYNYLDIQCPSEALYAATFDACYNLSITCLNDWREHAYLSYDFSDNEWNCGPYTASSYCCPYLETESVTDPTKLPSNLPSISLSESPTATAPTTPSARETDVLSSLSTDVVFSSLLVILLAILIIVIIFYFRALDSKIGNPHDQSLAVELIEQNANRTNAQIEVNDADDDVDM